MDRLNQLRGEAGPSRDSTLDTSSPPSEAFMTANESSSKYFSLSEVDTTFDISPIKDVSLTNAAVETESITEPDRLISNLSPIGKKNDFLDSYKIGKQIEAANILSGGVDIFDDNDNSYDGDELVIDDNAVTEDKEITELKIAEAGLKDGIGTESTLVEAEPVPSKDTEVILQIDGKNVDAIDIGNGLYLYRREGEEELAAVQIDEDQEQPSYKFLKVRENAEGNLEVYEEIQIEVPKELPIKQGKATEKNVSHVPMKDSKKIIADTSNKPDCKNKAQIESAATISNELGKALIQDQPDSKVDVNGILMKFSESRKSPVVGSFTPMTYHSTPNKEGIPLTKTMVNLQLHPNRHSDNVKKTIEVHTDSSKQKIEPQRNLMKDLLEEKSKETNTETITEEKLTISEETTLSQKNIKDSETMETTKNNNNECHTTKPVDEKSNEGNDKMEELETNVANDVCLLKNETSEKQNTAVILKENLSMEPEENVDKDLLEQRKTQENKKETELENKSSESEISPTPGLVQRENVNEVIENNINKSCHLAENIATKKDVNIILPSSDVNATPEKISKEFIDIENSANIVSKQSNKNIQIKTCNEEKIDIGSGFPLKDATKTATRNEIFRKCVTSNEKTLSETLHLKQLESNDSTKLQNISLHVKEGDKSVNISKENTNSKNFKNSPQIDLTENPTVDDEEILNIERKHEVKETVDNLAANVETIICNEEVKNVYSLKGEEANSESLDITKKDTALYEKTDRNEIVDKIHTLNEVVVVEDPTLEKIASGINTAKTEIIGMENAADEESNKKAECTEQKESLPESNTDKETNPQISSKVDKKEPTEISDSATKEALGEMNTAKCKLSSIDMKVENATKVQPLMNLETTDKKSDEIKTTSIENTQNKDNLTEKKAVPKGTHIVDSKTTSNNNAVPFGKWTEANRQAFLNRYKETKIPSNNSNNKQIKNSNDLNRRDFLKKIDTQRQTQPNTSTSKIQDFGSSNRLGVKKEASVFSTKSVAEEIKVSVKTETSLPKSNAVATKQSCKQESTPKTQINTTTTTTVVTDTTTASKKEPTQRKEINNQDLIDKTIEGIINRVAPSKPQDDNAKETIQTTQNIESGNTKTEQPIGLDEIEMKMNELHGIPFIERPPHELPRVYKPVIKTFTSESQKVSNTKQSKIPNLLPFATKNPQQGMKENVVDIDSEEEIIEHEPITGDMELEKQNNTKTETQITSNSNKNEAIITEKDFDKFVRRNSVNYENCITVNFDHTEPPNVINTVVQKDIPTKSYVKRDKYENTITSLTREIQNKKDATKAIQNVSSLPHTIENKHYQSKVKMAYQTAMTAKRQLERPITIIEDKPVKVVFMDSNTEFIPRQLNVQGKELSPAKKPLLNVDSMASDSLDSDITEMGGVKTPDDTKHKTKHQRKQVLTPVETPELELIEPSDLGIEVSPKKKRKTEEKVERSFKPIVPKKSYLLGRETASDDKATKSNELSKAFNKESLCSNSPHKNTASAIDNLVKAAELLETQSGNIINKSSSEDLQPDSKPNTPVKRGRGRPRKYPPTDSPIEKTKLPSPQKKPRLAEVKINKIKDTVENDDDDDDYDDEYDSSSGEFIKENWTMGKINENIVCPICNKLFRSENVVFKHVKHCTGPSPNRSESGNRSPRRFVSSRNSETKLDDLDMEDNEPLQKEVRKKRKSRDTNPKPIINKQDVIVIEDTPIKSKPEKREELKHAEQKKIVVNKSKINDLICEICGKTFRQLSYLINHKQQHEKEEPKKIESHGKSSKTPISCDVCKKEFRMLHHLVQHRTIHNLNGDNKPTKRKTSSDQSENKPLKETLTRRSDDASAGFRCEPCDKSFRKLHHLVEHRETHDGINRQKSSAVNVQHAPVEKPPPPPQCDICKKTFRKLHHLVEHKEQHLDTSSEKSDDKSVKSSLSTRDIIHECSLCYMVFPNEHSLNKHSVFCQRKKRQSASKQIKVSEETDMNNEDILTNNDNDNIDKDDVIIVSEIKENKIELLPPKDIVKEDEIGIVNIIRTNETSKDLVTNSPNSEKSEEKNMDIKEPVVVESKNSNNLPINSEKTKKISDVEIVKIPDTPKEKLKGKKTPMKEKIAPSITKRHKPNPPLDNVKLDSSDDDDIRYMFNPDFKIDNTSEGKIFLKVRANKRNSLQIERPNSKDLVKRRISLQHPPKIPKLKSKLVQNKSVPINISTLTKNIKPPKIEPVPCTDSDDSDVKYSFPKNVNKTIKINTEERTKDEDKKKQKKSLADKRKSLTGIAKRKSLGKVMSPKLKPKLLPEKIVPKKRNADVEHRCDCGQLFSSAALLSRHTTLAHTPPRIRRRRSPLPELKKAIPKPASRQLSTSAKPRQSESRKSSVKSDGGNTNSKTTQVLPSRNSSAPKSDAKPIETRKSLKTNDSSVDSAKNIKARRNVAHKGVPVPEKMRRMMEKMKK